MKALIVDDSAVMRKVVERALRQAGMELLQVVEAANGADALEALRCMEAGTPDDAPLSLILSDIHMPLMDGLAFLEAMRREGLAPDVPVVMITTEGSEQQVLRAIASGARGYICKPFTADQVKARILPLVHTTGSRMAEPQRTGVAVAPRR